MAKKKDNTKKPPPEIGGAFGAAMKKIVPRVKAKPKGDKKPSKGK